MSTCPVPPRHILIVGAVSKLGSALADDLNAWGFQVTGTTRRKENEKGNIYLDLDDPGSFSVPEGVEAAVFCAATTEVELCEREPERTRRTNVTNTMKVLDQLLDKGIRTVFISGNLVFDGTVPYRSEEDATCPGTQYGRQKQEVEQFLATNPYAITVRTTKVVTPQIPLLKGWIEQLKRGEIIRPILDMKLAPITLSYFCNAIRNLISSHCSGVFHIAGERDYTYEEFASLLAESIGADPSLIQPITREEARITVMQNRHHTVLSAEKLRNQTGIHPQPVDEVIRQLLGAERPCRVRKINEEVLYAVDPVVEVSDEDVRFMVEKSARNERKRIRICAHQDVSDLVHEMLIVHRKDTYVPPHKHRNKDESFHIIDGFLDVVLFNDDGTIRHVVKMGEYRSGQVWYYRLNEPVYHTLIIRSEVVVFHEVLNGPFHDDDTIFAPWAVDLKDHDAQLSYLLSLTLQVNNIR